MVHGGINGTEGPVSKKARGMISGICVGGCGEVQREQEVKCVEEEVGQKLAGDGKNYDHRICGDSWDCD